MNEKNVYPGVSDAINPLSSTNLESEMFQAESLFGALGEQSDEYERNENYYLSSSEVLVNDNEVLINESKNENEDFDLQENFEDEKYFYEDEEYISNEIQSFDFFNDKRFETSSFLLDKQTAKIIEQEAVKANPSLTLKLCEGLYCWAKSILNKQLNLNLALTNNLDEQTKKAIVNFQLKNNLPQTQRIDPITERSLLEFDAIQKYKGTDGETAAINIISSAKTNIENWTKQAIVDKPEITDNYRDPRKLWAFVLHHMAFKRKSRQTGNYSDPNSYLKTGAHFCIMLDGRIIQLHQFSRMIWHAQCISPRSVAVEFEGNFPNIKGKWWLDKDSTVQNKDIPTQAQYESGRFLISYLKIVLGTTHILAHRQSSDSRENDPGPDIWYNVGQWAIDNLKLTDGGPTFKCGTGNAILPEWRTWGIKNSSVVSREVVQNNLETTELDGENLLTDLEFYNSEKKPFLEFESDYDVAGEQFNEPTNQMFLEETNRSLTDWTKVIKLNRYYSEKLGWNIYHDKINDLLLPYSGFQNVSLDEEKFAQAISNWQSSQGFSTVECDGIIGPRTWNVMSQLLTNTVVNLPVINTPMQISNSIISYSIEKPPDIYSSDKVPEGFKPGSYKEWKGLDRKSNIRVDEAAKQINVNGVLVKFGITEIDIDTFQRISNAETGGRVQNFYSYDTAIVSIGFRQFTFIHNNIHDWINNAPEAFKKYGIEIDNSQPSYIIKRMTGDYIVKRIKGVDDPENLRWNGWAQRFYFAGLDHEIIIAEFLLAKEYFNKELLRLKNYLKSNPAELLKFMDFYNTSGHTRAFFHELNNAAPSRVPVLTSKAIINIKSNESSEHFLETYFETVKSNWPDPNQVTRIFENTSKGSKLRVFENNK